MRETFVLDDGNRASFRKAAFEETPQRWTNVQNRGHLYCNALSVETCYSDIITIICLMYMYGSVVFLTVHHSIDFFNLPT